MPELDCLSAFEYIIKRTCQQHQKVYKTPLTGHLQIHPRTFAVGTANKPWNSCFVYDMGYNSNYEPKNPDFQPHPHDLQRCTGKLGQAWIPYIDRQLQDGVVCVKARGKELLIAAGYHAMRINFGLEAHIAYLSREQYEKIIAVDCPGANESKAKREKMRSFLVPEELTDPAARKLKKAQRLEIFAAVVGEYDTFIVLDFSRLVVVHIMSLDRHWVQSDLEPGSDLWSSIWGAGYGPDWTFERLAADAVLAAWRTNVLESWPSHDVPSSDALLEVICSRQDIFNGYGRHTAHDLLHMLGLWPGMPTSVLCLDDRLFEHFKSHLHSYAAQFLSTEYRLDCVCSPTSLSPLAFNIRSNDNYINRYVLVYRKWEVRVPSQLYNELYKLGLFDPMHVIGEPYDWNEDQLCRTQYRRVQVRVHEANKSKWYSVIRARRPAQWAHARPGPGKLPSDDVRWSGMSTTLGPASFHNYKQNQHDPKLPGKRGRPAKTHTGKPGRPAKVPKIEVVREKANRTRQAYEKALAAEQAGEKDETADTCSTGGQVQADDLVIPGVNLQGRVTRSSARVK